MVGKVGNANRQKRDTEHYLNTKEMQKPGSKSFKIKRLVTFLDNISYEELKSWTTPVLSVNFQLSESLVRKHKSYFIKKHKEDIAKSLELSEDAKKLLNIS